MVPPTEYGFWLLAAVNAAVFIGFAYSFARPLDVRDWRSFGAFSAFIIALFAEMYGFPLTIYLLAGWLQTRWPAVNWFSHDSGHLLEMVAGPGINPHFGPFHLLSTVLIIFGFWLIAAAWPVLYRAARSGTLATDGPYARLRHPQYTGFILIMTGFLLQWPTLLTLAMYPVLLVMYLRLASREDAEAAARFGAQHAAWARRVPAWIPRWKNTASGSRTSP
jgi:protein-S-isoprenylcysteine O-methyltransferase Ste14